MIKSIWDLFNSKYNDASRYTEEETKLTEEVLSDVQTLLELDADKNDYFWHDIRKNPDDLPQKVGYYLCALKFRNTESLGVDVPIEYCVVIFCEGKFCGYNRMWDIKAWKEIEPLFEEENV